MLDAWSDNKVNIPVQGWLKTREVALEDHSWQPLH